MTEQQTHLSTLCENCILDNTRTLATIFCIDCSQTHPKFCGGCDEVIHSIKYNSKHRRYKIEEYAKVDHESCCPDHPSKELEFYCPKCQTLLCITCVLEKHSEHGPIEIDQALRKDLKMEKIEKSYLEMKKNLKEQTENYHRVKISKESSMKRVKKRVKKKLEKKIQILVKETESKKIELLEQVEKSLEKKNQVVSNYLQKAELIQLGLENCNQNLLLLNEFKQGSNSVQMAQIALESIRLLELIDEQKKKIQLKEIELFITEDEQSDPKLNIESALNKIRDLKLVNFVNYEVLVAEKTELKGPSMKIIKLQNPMYEESLGGIEKVGDVAYAISGWLNVSNVHGKWRSILHNGEENGQRVPAIWIKPNTTSILFTQDTVNQKNVCSYCPANNLHLNQWTHYAAVVNGKQMKHYINGKMVFETNYPSFPLPPIKKLYIVNPWYERCTGISVAQLAWIPYPISPSYVQNLFDQQKVNYL
ncbi:tripartite motif-containing protein [Anaeramoeba flamelloides]|uniref:Tripartite motif-containing protein n=1 Tax=Anaeramoeba flamelloides TaxID=1746091 RepID=A0ABQ8Y5E5_9EUKA|nr:tripartite motif-containing protein [Anaeramoeba flamelloides]